MNIKEQRKKYPLERRENRMDCYLHGHKRGAEIIRDLVSYVEEEEIEEFVDQLVELSEVSFHIGADSMKNLLDKFTNY